MRRVFAVLLISSLASVSAVVCGAAFAATEPAKAPTDPYFDLQSIGIPAVVHGRLVNYIFIQVRLTLAKGVDASKLQGEEPFIRDALVRAAAHTPFNPPEDGVHLDDARLKAEVRKEATARLGAGKVVAVLIRSETPQRRSGVPGGASSMTPASGSPP